MKRRLCSQTLQDDSGTRKNILKENILWYSVAPVFGVANPKQTKTVVLENNSHNYWKIMYFLPTVGTAQSWSQVWPDEE